MSAMEATKFRRSDACQTWRRRWWPAAIVLTVLLPGCASVGVRESIDIHQPGWTVREGQATWTPGRNQEPVTGELLLATRSGGSAFLQLSKPPFTVVVAKTMGGSWRVDYPLRHKSVSGRSDAPSGDIWFRLARCFAGPAPARPEWIFVRDPDGRWQLVNRRTGEQLEGFFNP